MGVIVAKFGGSSLATAGLFEKVAGIIQADEQRRYVIPSAPGKAPGLTRKVTDLLYDCQQAALHGDIRQADDLFAQVEQRYLSIVKGLGTHFAIEPHLHVVHAAILADPEPDYAASRGEYLNGLILANLLGYDFVDPAEGIVFQQDGHLDEEATQRKLSELLQKHPRAVVPGFYGALPDGHIKTFSRGGSDITGAIVARAVGAELYENWTDVSGFLMTDPRIVDNPRTISMISYKELRELSYMGASVLHEDSIFPVRRRGIPIRVRNTNRPQDPGTLIVPHTDTDDQQTSITGIAGRKGFTVIHMEKEQMNSTVGFGRHVLSILERHGVSFEHLPSGIDTLSLVIQDCQLEGKRDAILQELQEQIHPDVLEMHSNLALIATVGRGMIRRVGASATLFTALAEAGVNVRMIDQGSSEINIIVGVEEEDFETAVRAIYAAFVG